MMTGKKLSYILLALLLAGAFLFCKGKPQSGGGTAVNDSTVQSIDQLTREDLVVSYVKKHQQLPAYYIKKSEAREKGWDAATGNLCDVLPGKAIGGDVFSNREGSLPAAEKRKWFEADLNYKCGRRNADRLLYSSDGLIYVTHDHYKTFQQK
ncbi:ribonuclease domain-containing protein [Niabella sp. 22666]|uniref:ribonuclease domain-containing protein n=1 Tax=Niabella sp. 22666 TaxID=3453954 RepID=UPI003F8313FB